MTSKFKNRLVGSIIIVSLGVIFLPDVFDGEKAHYQETFQAIPLQDPIDQRLLTQEVELPITTDSYQPAQHETVTKTTTLEPDKKTVKPIEDKWQVVSSAPTPKPVVSAPAIKETPQKSQLQDSAWILRLGSFRNLGNAQALVKKLREKGYSAHISPRNVQAGQLARVEIGPDLSKDKMLNMVGDLESLTGLKGQLLRFNPLTQ